MSTGYGELPNERILAVNGIEYAYRVAGTGPVPLVLLQHFRGNLDNLVNHRDSPTGSGVSGCGDSAEFDRRATIDLGDSGLEPA